MGNVDEFVGGTRARTLCLAVAAGIDAELTTVLNALETDAPGSFARIDEFRPAQRRIADLVARLDEVAGSWSRPFTEPLALFPALGVAVDSAMPWQQPFVRDAVTAIPEVREALLPLAELLLASPAAVWWTSDIDLSQQWVTRFVGDGVAEELTTAPRLADWHRLTMADEEESLSRHGAGHGAWWSMPWASGWERGAIVWGGAPSSTRRLDSLGATALALVEDGSGDTSALLHRAAAARGARVYEVHSKADWAALVERYPLRVRWSRRGTWGASTGLDADWHVPDYAAVAQDFDAVHLSVAGYLSAAGDAILLSGDRATVIAGWAPDATFWLTGAVSIDDSSPERWKRVGHDMHEWVRVE